MTATTAATVATVAVNVLNASYQPLGATKLKRAMALILRGEAVVEESDPLRLVRHPGLNDPFPWPLVIRLLRFVKVPMKNGDAIWSKAGVLKRDGHRCVYCDRKADTVDHIIPQAKGGKNTWLNTAAACQPCNSKKADRLLEDCGMTLLYTPTVPQRVYLFAGKTHAKKNKKR